MLQPSRRIASLLFAALLVLGAAVSRRQTRYELLVESSSSVSSKAQLFYDVGQGFRKEDSSTQRITASAASEVRQVAFPLPTATIYSLRFDPLSSEGRLSIKDIRVRSRRGTVFRFAPSSVQPLAEIAVMRPQGAGLEVITAVAAKQPSLRLALPEPLGLKKLSDINKLRLFAIGAAALVLVALLSLPFRHQLDELVSRMLAKGTELFRIPASRYSSLVLPLDSLAIWFYIACLVLFFSASLLKLNGSSLSFYSVAYGHGVSMKPWLGAPRSIRSDEWSYYTPDILGQTFRSQRFAVEDSDLGPHSASLIGNIPVRDPSTLFRPQFWGFFLLPVEYAFAFYWQCKALFLVAGVFTWLLFITGSSRWAIGGALWFFFSAFTQWSYSWPSALPEMIGLACFGTVLLCYLMTGQNKAGIAAAAIGFAICTINFAMCGYVPHMIPIFWLNAAVFAAWCISHRTLILRRSKSKFRVIALSLSVLLIAAVGVHLYLELQQTLVAVSQTVYPGKRVVAGGSVPAWQLVSHFMQWTEAEDHYPAAIGNVSEGSGFLWLAPVALLCLPRLKLDRTRRLLLIALYICFFAMLAWLTLPIPAIVGHIFAFDKVLPARALPALGLANIAAVCLCASRVLPLSSRLKSTYKVLIACAIFGVSVFVLMATNAHLGHFFSPIEVLSAAAFTSFLISALIAGRGTAFMVGVVAANTIYFGNVNPIERGLSTVTQSSLFAFIQSHRTLLDGKWLVFSDTPVSTGFLASMGLQVYTGTRYCPDVDHFALFRQHGLDPSILNRLGYLDAHPLRAGETATVTLENAVVVRLSVSPRAPILKEIGVKYVAFDSIASPVISDGLIPLSSTAIDRFWLYQLP